MIEIDLAGQVFAVTGASGGLGSGIAQRLAAAGASLILHYRTTAPAEISGTHAAISLDLTTDGAADELVNFAVERFGRLDGVINNAAIQTVAGLLDMSPQEWSTMLDTNVTACHRTTTSFARHVIARGTGRDPDEAAGTGGTVINICSIEGLQPAAGHSHYSVSKAALLMHTRSSALELGQHGIRVNSISPGLIDRDGLTEDWPDGVSRWLEAAPLGRLGQSSDIGDACVMLCSPLAKWITGANLVVDGGVTARPTW